MFLKELSEFSDLSNQWTHNNWSMNQIWCTFVLWNIDLLLILLHAKWLHDRWVCHFLIKSFRAYKRYFVRKFNKNKGSLLPICLCKKGILKILFIAFYFSQWSFYGTYKKLCNLQNKSTAIITNIWENYWVVLLFLSHKL